jgi:hypothetical protein
MLGACSRQTPPAEEIVRQEISLPESPYQLEFRAFAFPDTGEGMNHVTYGLSMGRDGHLYVGIGNNRDNSYIWRFDEWPKYEAEHLGRIDPLGSEVFSNNLSLSIDQEIPVKRQLPD